jgi:hypothetical protein
MATNNHLTSIFTSMSWRRDFSLTKPRLHFNFEKSISLISLPLHSGKAKKRRESFCSGVFYSSSSKRIKLVAVWSPRPMYSVSVHDPSVISIPRPLDWTAVHEHPTKALVSTCGLFLFFYVWITGLIDWLIYSGLMSITPKGYVDNKNINNNQQNNQE